MIHRDVYHGQITEGLSATQGLFLIQANDSCGEQARVVLTEQQVLEHIERLNGLLVKDKARRNGQQADKKSEIKEDASQTVVA